MMVKQMRGIYAIPPVVYHNNLAIDYEGTARCVQFCLDCGAHGLVIPVYATEYFVLSKEERKKLLETCIEVADGNVPTVAGVSAAYVGEAVELSTHAREVGADAVIAAPPHVKKVNSAEIFDYYRRINDAAKIPVFIQNLFPPLGTPMDITFMLNMLNKLEYVSYVKEETDRARYIITELYNYQQQHPEGELKGIMAGHGGRALIEEHDRGVCGTMPPSQFTDIIVRIWDLLEEGKTQEAYKLHANCLPALMFSLNYGVGCYKTILKRRGIVEFDGCRPGGWPKLDEMAHRELNRIMELVEPLFTVPIK